MVPGVSAHFKTWKIESPPLRGPALASTSSTAKVEFKLIVSTLYYFCSGARLPDDNSVSLYKFASYLN